MTHAEAVARWLNTDGVGVEIGAFKTPVPGIRPFYVDRYPVYAYEATRADFLCDASALPFHSHALDYVVASHVLEHLANPVAALLEWHRVLCSGGMMYLVVPDRRFTFDHTRTPTDPEHMWHDFGRGVDQSDGTHVDEFVDTVDWARYAPALPADRVSVEREILRRKYHIASHGGEIDMHFHVFEAANLQALITLVAARRGLDWKVVELRSPFPDDCPNGVLLILRVHKPHLTRLLSLWHALRAHRNRYHVVRAGARRSTHEDEEAWHQRNRD